MLADYHRTRPLLNGEVVAKGVKLQPRRAESGEACLRPVYEEFDIAEMSLSWYMMARCRNEPVIALPIFRCACKFIRTFFAALRRESRGRKISKERESAWMSTV